MRVAKKKFVMTFQDGYKITYKGKYYTDHPAYKDIMSEHGKITSVKFSYLKLK